MSSDNAFRPSSGSRAVVMTVARDEAVMLPRWVEHYGRHVGFENLVVFDDNTTDGSTDDLPCTVHRLPRLDTERTPFEKARMRLLNGAANGFLGWYDAVVFTDVDEFLVPDPTRYGGLGDFLEARPDKAVLAPLALNVVQAPDEAALDPSRPVLEQRRFAKFVPLMCKPSIKRSQARWTNASHGIVVPFAVDPELFMLHLKFADRDNLRRSSDNRRAGVDDDKRPGRSSWGGGGDEMLTVLDQAVDTDLAGAPEFDPAAVDLAGLVVRHGEEYRTLKQGQVRTTRDSPLVRIPARLQGAL
ncbi:MAG TPA: glycosyltransferase family 2 protein [Nocardioidaceae bacterium]|nr:glycosyltransferase family 2 protein [Nocardioidaceae bacterium]